MTCCAKPHPIQHNGVKSPMRLVGERELCHGGAFGDLRLCIFNPGKNSQMQASASVTATGDSKAAIGEALKQALSGNRLQSISLHDERGDVLWLDEGALGPDEHNLVVEAAAASPPAPTAPTFSRASATAGPQHSCRRVPRSTISSASR